MGDRVVKCFLDMVDLYINLQCIFCMNKSCMRFIEFYEYMYVGFLGFEFLLRSNWQLLIVVEDGEFYFFQDDVYVIVYLFEGDDFKYFGIWLEFKTVVKKWF